MGTLKERLERAVADKGLSIGDAWNLLSEALEHIERLEAEVVTIKASCSLAAADAVRFQDERDGLEADARRYRYMRCLNAPDSFCWNRSGEVLDAAIDAVLSAQRGGERFPDGYFGDR